jgi:chemotaxis protein methyltransferase CheR
MLSIDHFNRTKRLAHQLAGIELLERHNELVARRSKRLGIVDPKGYEELLISAEKGDAEATRSVIRLFTTNFTGFFRHPRHFQLATELVCKRVQQRGNAKLWSAAASTGEEPYSLAMTLYDAFQSCHPPVSILATDIDTDALEIAKLGEYRESALEAVPPEFCAKYFQQTAEKGQWRIIDSIRRLVEFHSMNLVDDNWQVEGSFDVIFCRNVLMYLNSSYRQRVLERMVSLLSPEGLLILDPVEHLGKIANLFSYRMNGVYTLRRSSNTPVLCG